jgi:hypothetical protein
MSATQNAEAPPECTAETGPDTAPAGYGTVKDDRAKTPAAAPKAESHPPGDVRDQRDMPFHGGPHQIHAGMRS